MSRRPAPKKKEPQGSRALDLYLDQITAVEIALELLRSLHYQLPVGLQEHPSIQIALADLVSDSDLSWLLRMLERKNLKVSSAELKN